MSYRQMQGLRGNTFEELINHTNDMYRRHQLAVIQKIPTAITPVKLNPSNRTISLAYFSQKSTVDYIGVAQGIPICFDAKEISGNRLPLQNIHEHQIEFMNEFEKQKGIAFLLVSFYELDKIFFLPFETLNNYYLNSKKGGRKSIPYSDFSQKLIVSSSNGFLVHYLECINTYLNFSPDKPDDK